MVVPFTVGFLLIYVLAAGVLLRHLTFWSLRFEALAHHYLISLFPVSSIGHGQMRKRSFLVLRCQTQNRSFFKTPQHMWPFTMNVSPPNILFSSTEYPRLRNLRTRAANFSSNAMLSFLRNPASRPFTQRVFVCPATIDDRSRNLQLPKVSRELHPTSLLCRCNARILTRNFTQTFLLPQSQRGRTPPAYAR